VWEIEDKFRVRLGGNTYINCKTLVAVQGESLFSLRRHDDGYLGIDFDIYDDSGNRIATVRRNEIYCSEKDRYQIDGSLNQYKLTDTKTGEVICDIKKREDAHPAELEVSVRLYTPSGFLFDATPEQTNLLRGTVLRNNTISGAGTGISIE
jgi:hypothetical protein